MLLYDMTLFYVFTIALNLLIAFLLYRCEAADAKARKEAEKVEETKARLEQIREEAVTTIGNGYREGIGQLGEKMHIIGHRHLQGHFDIHLHVIVKRQKSPKNR